MDNTQKPAAGEQQDLTADQVLITVDTNDGNTRYNVYLDRGISRPAQYRNLTEFLFQAKEGDVFRLYLNGPGGHMDSCIQLIHALAETKGVTEAHLLGEVNSAHSNIFMACDTHIVYPYSMMMVHTFSGGFGGKGHDSARASITYNEVTANLYGDLYEGFLTDEELQNVLINNQDLYFHGKDIADRLGRVYMKRKEIEDAQKREEELAGREQVKALYEAVREAEAEEAKAAMAAEIDERLEDLAKEAAETPTIVNTDDVPLVTYGDGTGVTIEDGPLTDYPVDQPTKLPGLGDDTEEDE
tara:strand:+ start:518 stop:1414 length:897 start_codon:yes stop_codon:yes gene_type:complete